MVEFGNGCRRVGPKCFGKGKGGRKDRVERPRAMGHELQVVVANVSQSLALLSRMRSVRDPERQGPPELRWPQAD